MGAWRRININIKRSGIFDGRLPYGVNWKFGVIGPMATASGHETPSRRKIGLFPAIILPPPHPRLSRAFSGSPRNSDSLEATLTTVRNTLLDISHAFLSRFSFKQVYHPLAFICSFG